MMETFDVVCANPDCRVPFFGPYVSKYEEHGCNVCGRSWCSACARWFMLSSRRTPGENTCKTCVEPETPPATCARCGRKGVADEESLGEDAIIGCETCLVTLCEACLTIHVEEHEDSDDACERVDPHDDASP
jgi:hypothetical protein